MGNQTQGKGYDYIWPKSVLSRYIMKTARIKHTLRHYHTSIWHNAVLHTTNSVRSGEQDRLQFCTAHQGLLCGLSGGAEQILKPKSTLGMHLRYLQVSHTCRYKRYLLLILLCEHLYTDMKFSAYKRENVLSFSPCDIYALPHMNFSISIPVKYYSLIGSIFTYQMSPQTQELFWLGPFTRVGQ